jgi:hypothetical protein
MSLHASRSPGIRYNPFLVNDARFVAASQAWALRPLEPAEQVYLCAGVSKPYRIASTARTYGEFNHLEDARDFMRLLLLGNPDLELLS